MTSGSNHKYQLGLNPQERTLVIFNFKAIEQFNSGEKNIGLLSTSTVKFTRASCWNLNVAIDSEARAYLWGVLHDREVK